MKEENYEYDPIKEQIGGKAAEKVIWTTKAIETAVDGLKKGLPLKANPFIGKNTKLLRSELVYKRTAEEIEDYVKCMQDPIYFASKCHLMSAEGGLQPCKLRDYQIDYLKHLQTHNFSIFLSCRQSGKSTTTAIYALWVILFNTDKNALILSKSGPAGADLLSKIKDMYLYLPYHLKIGTMKWNQSEISFDNNSKLATESFSPTAGLGKTINFLILDEFAWCPPNDVELFYNNIIPTVTTMSDANVCIMSTQNGFNKFYKIWRDAVLGKNIYAPFKVDWDQVPQYNTETHKWEKRTEAWHKKMVGVLGSEDEFQYQYGTNFAASDTCLVSRECLRRIHEREVKFDKISEDFPIVLQHKEYFYVDPNFNTDEFKTGWFIILCDLAEGGGGDYTVFHIIQIVGKDKFKQVAYWYSNSVELQYSALEFWLLVGQLFSNERCIISIEWNTYGSLFYSFLLNYNEPESMREQSWRFNIVSEIDLSQIVQYKRTGEDIPGKQQKNKKTIPGIKMTSGNKGESCVLLKMELEADNMIIQDTVTVHELENFEDKNGSGSYKASIGHDDIIMTCVQIPLLKQTPKYKDLIEEYTASLIAETSGLQQPNIGDYFSQPFTSELFSQAQYIPGTINYANTLY